MTGETDAEVSELDSLEDKSIGKADVIPEDDVSEGDGETEAAVACSVDDEALEVDDIEKPPDVVESESVVMLIGSDESVDWSGEIIVKR